MRQVRRLHDEAICQRIGEAREAAGLTREGLARGLTAFTGTTVTSRDVGRYESSRVPWKLLAAIAHQTGTSKAWLLGGDEADAESGPPSGQPAWSTPAASRVAGRRARLPGGIAVLALTSGFLVAVGVERLSGSVPAGVLVMFVVVAVAVVRHMR